MAPPDSNDVYNPASRIGFTKLLAPEEMRQPSISWPTLGLFCGGLWVYLYCSWIGFNNPWSLTGLLCIPAIAASVFVLFTVLHEGVHGNYFSAVVLRDHQAARVAQEIMLYFSGFAFQACHKGFRLAHLEHHKFTNDPEKDPDTHVHGETLSGVILRWMTLDYNYIVWYLKKAYQGRARSHPGEVVEVIIIHASVYLIYLTAFLQGYGMEIMWMWWLPKTLATVALAYAFDFIPHKSFDTLASVDIYKSTNRTLAPHLDFAWLMQTYHIVHHLVPSIHWYNYRGIWDKHGSTLKARGVKEVDLSIH